MKKEKTSKGHVCDHCGKPFKSGVMVGDMFEAFGVICDSCNKDYDTFRKKQKQELADFFKFKKR